MDSGELIVGMMRGVREGGGGGGGGLLVKSI